MGSLLPGWDSERVTPPLGIGAELLEERRSLEKESLTCKRKSVDVDNASAPSQGPPVLSRKSAPSSFVIRKLQQAFPEESADGIDKEEVEPVLSATVKLYSRDKWWKKFSSGRLNELAREIEEAKGKQTYRPQFELAGGDPYIKKT